MLNNLRRLDRLCIRFLLYVVDNRDDIWSLWVMKTYRPWTPEQGFLLPPSPMDWLPEEHLAFFILDVVRELDLSALEAEVQAKDARGNRPHSPTMMVALLLYAYCVGIYSSRKIALGTYENVAMRVLAGGMHPHFTTINQFRKRHLGHLRGLFFQGLQLCGRAGLVTLGHVALDGTKIKANASKHKAMSYERMQEQEKRLQTEIAQLLERAEAADTEEDARYGAENADDLPDELRRRESRLARLREAKRELERDAAQARAALLEERAEKHADKATSEDVSATERKRAATRAAKCAAQAEALRDRVKAMESEDKDDEESSEHNNDSDLSSDDNEDARRGPDVAPGMPRNRVPHRRDGTPKPDAQRNFTDPDSRIMVSQKQYVQAYNAQIVVDASSQVIVAHGLSNQAADNPYLPPMLDRVHDLTGSLPDKMSADAGYFSLANVENCEQRGIDAYISTGRESAQMELDASDEPFRTNTPTTAETEAREDMRQKLASTPGREVYARRKAIVEPVFGQIKEARGFRRFSLRGLSNVCGEWSLVCLCHNLLKLFRYSPTAESIVFAE